MHMKRKHILSSRIDESWEEQAFAEDAAGALGGCIWPPRSYTCSFCDREFRSAQALGGHMNVHRRDRARLKQSTIPHHEIQHQNHHIVNLHEYCNPNPSSDHSVLASTSTQSRVSADPSLTDNFSDQKVLPFISPKLLENLKRTSLSSPPSWSNFTAKRSLKVFDPENGGRNSKGESGHDRVSGDYVESELSRLNLVVYRTLPAVFGAEHDEAMSHKRRRTDMIPLPLFPKPGSSVDRKHLKSEVLEFSSSSIIDDLDLELRLGN